MLKWLGKMLKREQGDDEDEPSGFVLGHAFLFENESLGVRYEGLPFELVDEMREDDVSPSYLANHIETGIQATEVFQEQPVLQFHGSPHAEGVMELMDALSAGHFDVAGRLLERDPAIIHGDHDGAGIPLLLQVFDGAIEAVTFLIANDADVNKAGHLDMSPLHWAAACGHLEVTKALLGAGANGDVLNALYATPVELARLNGHRAVAAELETVREAETRESEIEAALMRMGCFTKDAQPPRDGSSSR